jgi:hypothetical protein
MLRAEDGFGLCDLPTSKSEGTSSVAFAFETGEVLSVDTTLLKFDTAGLSVSSIEKLYAEHVLRYARFLGRIGLIPPYHWISGISGTKGRFLRLPLPPRYRQTPTYNGPECLSENITAEGTYDGKQSGSISLAPFFNLIFHNSGVSRSDFDLPVE